MFFGDAAASGPEFEGFRLRRNEKVAFAELLQIVKSYSETEKLYENDAIEIFHCDIDAPRVSQLTVEQIRDVAHNKHESDIEKGDSENVDAVEEKIMIADIISLLITAIKGL